MACRKWSYEEKVRIIKRYLNEDIGMNSITSQEVISRGLIWCWIKKRRESRVEGLETHSTGLKFSFSDSSDDSFEVQKLKHKILPQELQIERLKKDTSSKDVVQKRLLSLSEFRISNYLSTL